MIDRARRWLAATAKLSCFGKCSGLQARVGVAVSQNNRQTAYLQRATEMVITVKYAYAASLLTV